MKRSWTNIKELEPQILEMRATGKTRREIADILGLNSVQVKNWINRHNKKIIGYSIFFTIRTIN